MSASSGEQALKLFADNAFDLVMTDHAMPGMTGAQLAAELRALAPSVRVILATGYADLEEETASGVPRLSKPFSLADLEAAVAGAAKRG
jgi:YesN/AraC family two-component response regulator